MMRVTHTMRAQLAINGSAGGCERLGGVRAREWVCGAREWVRESHCVGFG